MSDDRRSPWPALLLFFFGCILAAMLFAAVVTAPAPYYRTETNTCIALVGCNGDVP